MERMELVFMAAYLAGCCLNSSTMGPEVAKESQVRSTDVGTEQGANTPLFCEPTDQGFVSGERVSPSLVVSRTQGHNFRIKLVYLKWRPGGIIFSQSVWNLSQTAVEVELLNRFKVKIDTDSYHKEVWGK